MMEVLLVNFRGRDKFRFSDGEAGVGGSVTFLFR